jgi:hypothetical protein
MVRRVNGWLAGILALDDPGATAAVEREIVTIARREGRREQEIVTLGNMAEDVRRTGDWDWMLAELDGAIRDEDRNVTDLLVDVARATLLAYRGEIDDDEAARMTDAIRSLDDPDVASAAADLRASMAFARGDFAEAARGWIRNADESDLNAPYALPKAGLAAVLGDDEATARLVLDRLAALGSRGRAIEADIASIRAGVAAMQGDREAAMSGFRTAWAAFRDLGLAWDQALLTLAATARVGPGDPDVESWLPEARATLLRVHASPLVARLDQLVAEGSPARPAAPERGAVASSPRPTS